MRELDTLRTTRNLSGLVLWFVRDREPPALPGPIVDRFEPIALDRHSTKILDALLEGQAVLDQRGSDWWRSRQRGQRVTAWFMGGSWLTWFGSRLVPDIIGWIKTGSVPAAYVLFVTLVLATLSLIVLVQRQWFLIAQGVLCRPRTTLRARSLERFTRMDSTLLIAPQDESWMAYVCQGGCVRRRELDDRERLALLAAWQSRVPPPELSQLGDCA